MILTISIFLSIELMLMNQHYDYDDYLKPFIQAWIHVDFFVFKLKKLCHAYASFVCKYRSSIYQKIEEATRDY
jgi:hypothetical protein